MSTINLNDYSKDASQKGWGKGWPSCEGAKNSIVMVTTTVSSTKLPVHNRISDLVRFLANETERRGYRLKPAQCWGYNCRQIAGTNRPSNHSWGLAVDLNWNDNPYNTTSVHAMPTWVARLWNEYGFAWGGDYSGNRQDWMHLEFMGTPAQADEMSAIAVREFAPVKKKGDLMNKFDIEYGTIGQDGKFSRDPDGLDFRAVCDCELGTSSLVISRAWAKFAVAGDGAHFAFDSYTLTKGLGGTGQRYIKTLSNGNSADYWEIPAEARLVTLYGKRDSTTAIVSASILPLAK